MSPNPSHQNYDLMCFKKYPIFFLVLILFISCYNKKDESFDFTEEDGFTSGIEGPAVDSKGNLYAVNYKEEGTIGVVDRQGNVKTFATLPNGSVGNGIRFDNQDNMYIADYTNHNILLIKQNTSNAIVYAHDSDLNQPNDVAIAPGGILYASDPNWKNNTGNLWKIDDSGFFLLESNMGTTNGIEVSPDGKKLYVNESIQRKIWIYEINEHGEVYNKQLFYSFSDFGLDGMRCDKNGNLFVCRYNAGKVVVINPEGKLIREVILTGEKPSNITFGVDYKQCFVTMADRGCIESFYTN